MSLQVPSSIGKQRCALHYTLLHYIITLHYVTLHYMQVPACHPNREESDTGGESCFDWHCFDWLVHSDSRSCLLMTGRLDHIG